VVPSFKLGAEKTACFQKTTRKRRIKLSGERREQQCEPVIEGRGREGRRQSIGGGSGEDKEHY